MKKPHKLGNCCNQLFILIIFFIFSNNLSASESIHPIGIEAMPCDTMYIFPQPTTEGDLVRVDFVVEDFEDIVSMQYSIHFDATIWQLQNVGNFNPGIPYLTEFNFNTTNSDYITFSWVDQSFVGVTLPNGAVMHSIYFIPLSNTETNVYIDDNPTFIEISDNNQCIVELFTSTSCPPEDCNDGICSNGVETWDENSCSCVDGTPPTPCTDDGVCSNGEEVWVSDVCVCEQLNVPNPSTCVDDGNCSNGEEVWNTANCMCEQINIPNPGACFDDGNCNNGIESWDSNSCTCIVTQAILGCTNPSSPNFNMLANCDDGSCECTPDGCIDPNACNYNPNATCNDGSCIYQSACDDGDCTNGLETWDDNSCTCIAGTPPIPCTDDGDCTNGIESWNASTCACDVTQPTLGCTDPSAPNYNPAANCDDGSCTDCSNSGPCDDGNSCTVEDAYNADCNCVGTPTDCGTGPTSIQQCDDGNPQTINDMETILICDGSICVPCAGIPSGDVYVNPVLGFDGDQIRIDLQVESFVDVVSIQFTVAFDGNALQFDNFGNFNTALTQLGDTNFGTFVDHITFSYISPDLSGITLPNGATIYSLYFTPLTNATSQIYLTGQPTTMEISNSQFNLLNLSSIPLTIEGEAGCSGPCDDNNPCTSNDIFDINCNCVGTPIDGACSNVHVNPVLGAAGDQIRVDLVVESFIDVVSLQFTVRFNGALLQFDNLGNFNSALQQIGDNNFGTFNDYITFSYVTPDLNGVTLANGTILYSLYFTPIGTGQSQVYLTGEPTTMEVSNGAFNILQLTSTPVDLFTESCNLSGSCDDNNPCTGNDTYNANCDCVGIPIAGACNGIHVNPVLGSAGDQVRVDINVEAFTNVVSIQYSLQFDGAVLQLDEIGNFNPAFEQLGTNNFGQFDNYNTFSYSAPSLNGISLPDGTTIYSLYFTRLSNTTSEVYINGQPTPMEASDAQQNLLVLNTTALTIEGDQGQGNDCPSAINGFTAIGELNDSKYFISNSIATPEDLQAMAAQNGGHLVTINNAAENEFIFSNINDMVYIGLTDAVTEGSFVWYDQAPLNYSNVDNCDFCQPNNEQNDFFVMHSWNGKWSLSNQWNQRLGVIEIPCEGSLNECDCASVYDPVCGTNGITYSNSCFAECEGVFDYTSGECSTSGEVCDAQLEGFQYLGTDNGSSYYLSNSTATPTFAEEISVDLGGHLITINSQVENDFISSQINDMVYIGYNDEANEGNMSWVSGEQSSYANFDNCSACPGNSENDDFVVMQFWNGGWSYSNFWNPRHFVMEIPCTAAPTPFLAPQEATTITIENLFPNPATNELFVKIESTNEATTSLFIFNSNGQLKYERAVQLETGNTAIQLDLSDFSNGLYYLQLQDKTGSNSYKKFVKM